VLGRDELAELGEPIAHACRGAPPPPPASPGPAGS
jgi:hypothetical protein